MHFAETEQHYFPVMDSHGKLSRIFSINDSRSVLFAPGIGSLVVMKDIGTSDIITTSPSEDLNSVLKKFTVKNIDNLPVVRDEDARELIGMLNRREVIAYYNSRIDEMKAVGKGSRLSFLWERHLAATRSWLKATPTRLTP